LGFEHSPIPARTPSPGPAPANSHHDGLRRNRSGAGIVGVSAALHLQDRGRKVALVDRAAPGEGTSFGNAGLIERSSIEPYPFPRSPFTLMRYALNRSTDLYWHSASLPAFAPWLARFWWNRRRCATRPRRATCCR
jgi:glycine/D-amino acid oxidase-like deaminating enzyme